jgi:ActR/RegA family two-component response regulator
MAEQEAAVLLGRRLLIVEDDYMIAIDLARELEERGAEIAGLAGSVEDAQTVIDAEGDRIDGAVLDVNLGAERVYPVADALTARGVPFVFATGYDPWVIPEPYRTIPLCEKPIRASVLARLLAEGIT